MPNVVYSCGAVIHRDQLILPFSVGDTYSSIAIAPLDEIFHRILSKDTSQKIISKEEEEKTGRILLVEDDLIQQKIVASILRSNGYEVEIAADGIVALIKLSSGPFDMILSDINMPNFDGLQLLEYLRQNKIEIPVLFLTSVKLEEIEKTVKQYGARDVLNKPVNRELLLKRIREIIV
jgi:CheY-like chemotaxis protein